MTTFLFQDLYRILESYGKNRIERELLIFWGKHPFVKYDSITLHCLLGCKKSEMDRALKNQLKAKLVDVKYEHGQMVYSLTAEMSGRQPILALSTLHWGQAQTMLEAIERETYNIQESMLS